MSWLPQAKQALIAGRTKAKGMCRAILIALTCAIMLESTIGGNSKEKSHLHRHRFTIHMFTTYTRRAFSQTI
jgi:hypothetical protein